MDNLGDSAEHQEPGVESGKLAISGEREKYGGLQVDFCPPSIRIGVERQRQRSPDVHAMRRSGAVMAIEV